MDLLTYGLFTLAASLLAALLAYNLTMLRGQSCASVPCSKAAAQGAEMHETSMLCRFVVDCGGKRIGETIAVDGDVLILKNGKEYLGLPISAVEAKDEGDLTVNEFDAAGAGAMGEVWRVKNFRLMRYGEDGLPLNEKNGSG